MKLFLSLVLALAFVGCSTMTGKEKALEAARTMSPQQRETYYKTLYSQGVINESEYKDWSTANARIIALQKQEAAEWAAMTPYERKMVKLKEQELALQQAELDQMQRDSMMAGVRHSTGEAATFARSNAENLNNSANAQTIANAAR
ncbi:hypothetical protein TSACC_3692 [Terrimicrobium sacchariphilum]|uniref:DUF4398 domain-containing protein n=1 Tax=Terrimicrobium sacchariphilum TaxID=690879 RepID=A0A146GE72_TERSA|nr:hypothetical protein [Terrimicrobium sacchariphilum]GAT35621.1 hypothetical protein TSACC_3692 [Terrimicrobium sacchariphilum]